jgi:hypothetical protein
MPVFIWLRYENKDFSKFDLNQQHNQEKPEKKDPLDFDRDQMN